MYIFVQIVLKCPQALEKGVKLERVSFLSIPTNLITHWVSKHKHDVLL